MGLVLGTNICFECNGLFYANVFCIVVHHVEIGYKYKIYLLWLIMFKLVARFFRIVDLNLGCQDLNLSLFLKKKNTIEYFSQLLIHN